MAASAPVAAGAAAAAAAATALAAPAAPVAAAADATAAALGRLFDPTSIGLPADFRLTAFSSLKG
jgi:hypothetical protein